MDLTTLYFNTIGSDLYLIAVEAAFAIGSFYLWRKHRHTDYLWLAALWVILLLTRAADYAFDSLIVPHVYLPIYFYLVFLFNLATSVISWIAIFYILTILFKRYVRHTPRREAITHWLLSRYGIAAVITATLAANIALTLYIASTAA